ncbi:MAG TPA: Ig-like domain-containing protein [Gaiellaceae bacterium]|nr:Ig-like domain-containing protein [Gaiellaceae bacterium]
MRKRSFVVLLLALAAASALLIGSTGSASATSTVTYSQQETQPIPPAQNYAGSSGGDGYTIALYNGHVYNVFHHATDVIVDCHLQLNAQPCSSNFPETITNAGVHFATTRQEDIFLDPTTGKLWVYAVRESDHTTGVVCIDTTVADTNPNPFCGFVALSAVGQGYQWAGNKEGIFGAPLQVGSKIYSFNYYGAAGVSGSENTVLCFDMSTQAACTSQPYSISLGSGTVDATRPEPENAAIGTELIIPVSMSGNQRLACFDTLSDTTCSNGSWPVSTPGIPVTSYGAPYPLLTASGATTGFCLPNGTDPCFNLGGASTGTPAGMTAAIPQNFVTNGPAFVLGPRIYVANHINNTVDCYDYSTSSGCANFPLPVTNIGSTSLYTVNPDPQRPECIWINSDNGAWQIQNFDAYTGGPCTQDRVLTSQFVVSGDPQCFPTNYTSFQIVTPAPSLYGGGSISFADGDGNPILHSVPLDNTGTADLTGLNLNTPTGLPQFLITLNNGNISGIPLTVKLTWTAPYDPQCATGGQLLQQPDALDAVLNDGTTTSHFLTDVVGTPVTNNSNGLLTGANTGSATGTVTYHWWTDNTCSTSAAPDSVQTIGTPGTLPASAPVNLPVGTYYETVNYSGDTLNAPASTSCGSEKLIVYNLPTDIVYEGTTELYSGQTATIKYLLSDQTSSLPLANEYVTITLPWGGTYSGYTDANGILSTTQTAPNVSASTSYPTSESFAGLNPYRGSSGPGSIIVDPIPTDISYVGDTSVYSGQTANIEFQLTNHLTGLPIANEYVTITLPWGGAYSGNTDSNGDLSTTAVAPPVSANTSYPTSESFGGSAPYLQSTGPGSILVKPIPTNITYIGDTQVYSGQPATLTFVLRDQLNNLLPNQSVTIHFNGTDYPATTDGSGVASVTVTSPIVSTNTSFPTTENFGGNAPYLASVGPGSLLVKPIPTSITYIGDTNLTAGQSANLSFVLKDQWGNVLPNEPVTITLPGGLTVSGTTDANGVFSTTTGPLSAGTYSTSEAFGGKNQYLASTGPGTITVTAPPPPPLDCTKVKCESLLADPSVVSNTQLQIVEMDDASFATAKCQPTALLFGSGQQLAVSVSPTSGQPQSYVDNHGGSMSTKYENLITINLPSGLAAGQYTVRVTTCDGDGDQDQWGWTIAVDGSGHVTTVNTGPGQITCGGPNHCESLLADPAVSSNSLLTIVAMDDSPIGTSGATAPSAVLTNGQVLNVTTSATSGQPQNYVDANKGSTSTKYQTLISIALPSLAAGNYTIRVTAYDGDGDLDQYNWPISVDSSGNVSTGGSGGGGASQLGPGNNTCSGVFSGTGGAVTVPAGATCTLLPGTVVTGAVNVAKGGILVASGVTIGQNLAIQGSATVCGSSVGNDLTATGSPGGGPVVIGGSSCAGNTVTHDMNVTGETGGVSVVGNTVGHDMNVKNDGPTTVVSNNTVVHDANCGPNTGQSGSGNSSGHNNSCPI